MAGIIQQLHELPNHLNLSGQGQMVAVQMLITKAVKGVITLPISHRQHRLQQPQPLINHIPNGQRFSIQIKHNHMGTWDYSYNGLGEVIAQTDANSNVFTFNYDRLGRLREQETAGLCNRWDYDSPNNEGLLISEQRDDCSPGGQLIPLVRKVYDYDGVNRPMGVQQQLNHPNTTVNAMSMGYSYDSYFGVLYKRKTHRSGSPGAVFFKQISLNYLLPKFLIPQS